MCVGGGGILIFPRNLGWANFGGIENFEFQYFFRFSGEKKNYSIREVINL